MDIDIRNYINDNFKGNNRQEILESIEESIQEGDEITLPGLGVFFEKLWADSDQTQRDIILSTLETSFK